MINFSENIESLEEIILAYLLCVDDDSVLTDEEGVEVDRGKLVSVLKPDFFTVQYYHDAFKHIRDFYYEYGKTPNVSELAKMFELKNESIDESKMNSIKNVKLGAYSNDFIYKYLKAFLMVRVLNSQINKVAIKLKTEKPDPDNINKVVDYVRTELSENIDVEITNSGNGLDIYTIDDHIQKDRDTKSTGVEYLDLVLGGGYEPKTFIVFQGRAKIGKSMVMSNLAARAALLGNNVGIFTVELGGGKYVKRIGSNLFNIPSQEYNSFKSKEDMSVLANAMAKFKEDFPNAGMINIKEMPTGSATVLDIENYFVRYEKKNNIKMSVIFVDYLNLLKPSDNTLTGNMYLAIKKICEELRKIAQRNDWCIVSATQIKTSSFSSDDLGLDSTAESSGLIATVDTLFGLMGQPDSPYVKMKCIANRDGGYMNSYANFVKDMNFFRLNEDSGEYMNLGEEAIINAENYKKYREAPSQTYSDFQYKVMQSADAQAEMNEMPHHNDTNPINSATQEQCIAVETIPELKVVTEDDFNLDARIDNISQQPLAQPQYSVNANEPVFDMPMDNVEYSMPAQQAQPVQTAQPQASSCVYSPKPVSAPNYSSSMAIKQPAAQPPQYAQQQMIQQPIQQPPQYVQSQYNPPVNAVPQPQYQNVQQKMEPAGNDTSTLIVNNLNEDEKIAIIRNNSGVQSIVSGL